MVEGREEDTGGLLVQSGVLALGDGLFGGVNGFFFVEGVFFVFGEKFRWRFGEKGIVLVLLL